MESLLEFDENDIERSLVTWEFDLRNVDTNRVLHVPMHGFKVSTKDKYLLYIENLQCCVGLYVYGNNFAFLAHINTVIYRNDDYFLDSNNPIYLSRIDNLIDEVIKAYYENNIYEPFKIGVSYGFSPISKDSKSIVLIYEAINRALKILNDLNIPIVMEEDMNEACFLIDSSKNSFIFSDKVRKLK